MDPKVEASIKTLRQWQLETQQLRNILLGSELTETLKEKLVGLAHSLLEIFLFIYNTVRAHLERIPAEHHP